MGRKRSEQPNGETPSSLDSPAPRRRPAIPPELQTLRSRARAQVAPTVSPQESLELGQLLPLLLPSIVEIPPRNPQGTPKEVLREPFLMLSWDRAVGAWKWAITDKTYQVQTIGHVLSLIGLAEQINIAVANGKVAVKDLEIKSDDGKWQE